MSTTSRVPDQNRCFFCYEPFKYPVKVKWIANVKAYVHESCAEEQGLWATIKWIFRGFRK